MANEPAGRWQSAAELQTALERIPRQASLKRWRLILLAAALLACAVTIFIWTRPGHPVAEMNPVSLFSTTGWVSAPAFSSDGSRVAYSWSARREASDNANDDPSGNYVKQIGGGPPMRLTRDETSYLAWSPDDRYIAFYRGDEILLVPSIGGPERRIAKAEVAADQGVWGGIFWTPDGKWLVVSTRDSPNEPYGIWLLSAETGERHRLLPSPAAVLRPGSYAQGDFIGGLSPDGRVLAFARTVREFVIHLYTVRLTRDFKPEGMPHLLVDKGYPSFKGMAWASNRDIVYSVGWYSDARLWRIRVGAGFPELLNWAAPGASQPAIALAQHRLAYAVNSVTGKLWRMDLRTGERRTIVDSRYEEYNPQYSPDGRKLAFDSERSGSLEVWTCDADGTNCQQLTFFEGPAAGPPRWSPDGRWIALDSRVEGTAQIYVIPSDGGKPRRVTSGDAQSQVPSWSRDGKWIYFESDRSGQWRVWKVPAEGGSAVQVTRNISGAAFESVDRKYLYIVPTGNNYPPDLFPCPLFRMPVAGGPEVEVAPKVHNWHCFSVTAKGVYFVSDARTLQLLDAATGKITTVATADKPSFSDDGISVSPDDAYMVFAEWELGGSDLMLVENFR